MAQLSNSSDDRVVTVPSAKTETAVPDDHQNLVSDPLLAPTSLDDSGQGKRPRDARLLHIILASLGVQAYQERVPLQLMDFAYRYTSGTLQDALHLTSEVYGTSGPGNKHAVANDFSTVTLQALRLAIASRQHYQFQPILPKEHFQDVAAERNRIGLPPVGRNVTIRLPPERYCLTGIGFGLQGQWSEDIEIEQSLEQTTGASSDARSNGLIQADTQMSETGNGKEENVNDEEMEDV